MSFGCLVSCYYKCSVALPHSASRLVCSVWLWYFLIISVTYFLLINSIQDHHLPDVIISDSCASLYNDFYRLYCIKSWAKKGLTLYLHVPMLSADKLYNQFGPSSSPTKHLAWIDPNCLTLWWYSCKNYPKKLILKKISSRQKKTRARSQWGAIANPHAKVFDSPSIPRSHPGASPWQQNENSVQYVFYLLFVRWHTKFGIKSLKLTL